MGKHGNSDKPKAPYQPKHAYPPLGANCTHPANQVVYIAGAYHCNKCGEDVG